MIIKQFSSLASNDVRRDILTIAEAGYEAIRIDTIVQSKLSYTDGVLRVGQSSYRLSDYKRVGIVGFGKGSSQLAASIEKLVGNAIVGGVVIDIAKAPTKKVHVFVGTHPLPTEQNIKATKNHVTTLLVRSEVTFVVRS
jgi:hydroxypyruvate reductase